MMGQQLDVGIVFKCARRVFLNASAEVKIPKYNGGKCPNCQVRDESGDDALIDADKQVSTEMLPLVSRSADTLNCM